MNFHAIAKILTGDVANILTDVVNIGIFNFGIDDYNGILSSLNVVINCRCSGIDKP
jgi:hypothetical protein